MNETKTRGFAREELIVIAERAMSLAYSSENFLWKLAASNLAMAASALDGFYARCEDRAEPPDESRFAMKAVK